MKHIRKLSPLNDLPAGLIYLGNGLLFLIAAVLGYWIQYLTFLGFLLLFPAVLILIFAFRTGNYAFLAGALHYSVLASLCFAVAGGCKTLMLILAASFCFTLFLNIALLLSKKVKWRRREILEAAAFPVNETENGFTGRPKPAGTAEYSRDDILEFSAFLLKNLIAIPYLDEKKAVFVITKKRLRHLLNLKNTYTDETYVIFDFDGKVTVNITKDDYLLYKDELTFDQLTFSLGQLFKEFLELFKKDESIRIINRLNALKISPFEGFMLF